MIQLSVETKGLMNQLTELRAKGLKYAVATAMTRTAVAAKKAFDQLIQAKVDRPRPMTKGATRYKASSKDRIEYLVYIKGDDWDTGPRGKEVNPNQYLRALILGGYRANKKSEMLLRANGVLPPGWQLQPGDDAPLDAYGNIPGSKYVQMLSYMKAFKERGFTMNRNTSGKTHRNQARDKKRPQTLTPYFVLYSLKTKTPTGIYTRQGKQVRQFLKFVPKRAKYTKLLDFKDTIDATFKAVFEGHFREALEAMIIKVKSW
jgi:hypothetical protein